MRLTLRRIGFYLLFMATTVTIMQKWPPIPTDAFTTGRWLALIAGWMVLACMFDAAYRLIRMYVLWEQKQEHTKELQPLTPMLGALAEHHLLEEFIHAVNDVLENNRLDKPL